MVASRPPDFEAPTEGDANLWDAPRDGVGANDSAPGEGGLVGAMLCKAAATENIHTLVYVQATVHFLPNLGKID